MKDIYQAITDRIIASLEAGVPPWIRPWARNTEPLPINAGSRREYRGINVVLLSLEAMSRGYRRNAWLTFRQSSELGGFVKKGSVGTTIVFFKVHEIENRAGDELGPRRSYPLLRAFTVFNLEQIHGLPVHMMEPPLPTTWQPLEDAERLLADTKATIRHGGGRAFYRPVDDVIQLPEPGVFFNRESYYAAALHELTHWTGHPSRLDRHLSVRFGASSYAMEEMIAEMGSAFVGARIGISGRLQHASYIANWLQVLANDKRAVFTAAAKAQQAADFILATSQKTRSVVTVEGALA